MGQKRRAISYYGLHFDFHATDGHTDIGTRTTPERLGLLLDTVKPDFLQVDTKGHPGCSSYATKIGYQAPGLVIDHLRIIREETKKRGILLIAHHSSLFDRHAVKEHPEWAIVNRDGSLSDRYIDPLSGYSDTLLIPQLKELAGEYEFDGAWVDGDNWCSFENYHPDNLARFYQESGFDQVDEEPNSPSRVAFRNFCRKNLRKYIAHYISEVKKEYPHFEIASNDFCLHAPEPPVEEIDFLSTDLMANDLRFCPRIFASHDKPWDIMRWSMHSCYVSPEISFYPNGNRHINRLKRDGSFAVSMGGGYQYLTPMTPKGEIRLFQMDQMADLGKHLRDREAFCRNAKPIHSTKVFISDYNDQLTVDFGAATHKYTSFFKAVFDPILDSGRPAGAISECHIRQGALQNCQALILPETRYFQEDILETILSFVKNGGSLVACGVECCRSLSQWVAPGTCGDTENFLHVEVGGNASRLDPAIAFRKEDAEDVCTVFRGVMDYDAERASGVITFPYGKGRVFFIGYDLFSAYQKNRHFVHADVMRKVLDRADPDVIAYLESGLHRVDIIPAQKEGRLIINAINTAEYYYDANKMAYGEFPSLTDVTIAVRSNRVPVKVTAFPADSLAGWEYDRTHIHLKLSGIDIHTVIAIDGIL